jgi:hypothetical protein
MSRPNELCRYQLPNGETCRQITLKGEHLCRHHHRLNRHSETEMAQQEAMERLAASLVSLELPDLLRALYGKLSRIRTTVRSHPEAQLALEITLHRLLEEIIQTYHPAQASQPLSAPINFPEILIESMNYNADFLKTKQNQ